nr:mucin-2-like [Cherax quadricarinatus]
MFTFLSLHHGPPSSINTVSTTHLHRFTFTHASVTDRSAKGAGSTLEHHSWRGCGQARRPPSKHIRILKHAGPGDDAPGGGDEEMDNSNSTTSSYKEGFTRCMSVVEHTLGKAGKKALRERLLTHLQACLKTLQPPTSNPQAEEAPQPDCYAEERLTGAPLASVGIKQEGAIPESATRELRSRLTLVPTRLPTGGMAFLIQGGIDPSLLLPQENITTEATSSVGPASSLDNASGVVPVSSVDPASSVVPVSSVVPASSVGPASSVAPASPCSSSAPPSSSPPPCQERSTSLPATTELQSEECSNTTPTMTSAGVGTVVAVTQCLPTPTQCPITPTQCSTTLVQRSPTPTPTQRSPTPIQRSPTPTQCSPTLTHCPSISALTQCSLTSTSTQGSSTTSHTFSHFYTTQYLPRPPQCLPTPTHHNTSVVEELPLFITCNPHPHPVHHSFHTSFTHAHSTTATTLISTTNFHSLQLLIHLNSPHLPVHSCIHAYTHTEPTHLYTTSIMSTLIPTPMPTHFLPTQYSSSSPLLQSYQPTSWLHLLTAHALVAKFCPRLPPALAATTPPPPPSCVPTDLPASVSSFNPVVTKWYNSEDLDEVCDPRGGQKVSRFMI